VELKKQGRTSGQTLIEFVFILPLLLLLLFGLFDFGRAVIYFAILNTAVREGTRTAIVQNWAKYELASGFSTDGTTLLGEDYFYPIEEIDLSLLSPCAMRASDANEIICASVTNKLFFDELFNSTLTITPVDIDPNSNNEIDRDEDPKINLHIEFIYEPITPLLEPLVGAIPISVESQMLLTPNAIR
jgi:hypothetical protein